MPPVKPPFHMQNPDPDETQVAAAAGAQAALCKRVATFFGSHVFLLCPATMVAPFDAEVRRVTCS